MNEGSAALARASGAESAAVSSDAPAPFADAGIASRGPMVAMLARIEACFEAEFDRRITDTEFCSLSLAHSRNVLRHLGAGPQRASRLVELAGVTKQAISQQLAQLARDGYVAIEGDPADHRARLVGLTDRGRRAQRVVRRLFAEIEHDWAGLLGRPGDFPRLRELVADLFDRLCPQAAAPGGAC
jgi:DNA-binding MarR family transcriptional regulator